MGAVDAKTFRIDTETADKFRTYCKTIGLNQAQAFDHIMQIAEMDLAKTALPGRATEIEEFERHTKSLLEAYLRSLEIAQDTESRVLEQYKSMLASKDEQILTLQKSLHAQEELAAAANTAAMEAENKQKQAEKERKDAEARAQSAQAAAQDKTAIADMLSAKLAEAESRLKNYPALCSSLDQAKEELSKANQELKDMKRTADVEREKAIAAIQRTCDKALLDAEREKNAIERELREKISELLEDKGQLKDQISDLRDQITALKGAAFQYTAPQEQEEES